MSSDPIEGWEKPLSISDVVRLLATDRHSQSGWMRHAGNALDGSYRAGDISEPREACLRTENWWVNIRASGRYVSWWTGSGWDQRYPTWISAWRLRRAVARWGRNR